MSEYEIGKDVHGLAVEQSKIKQELEAIYIEMNKNFNDIRSIIKEMKEKEQKKEE